MDKSLNFKNYVMGIPYESDESRAEQIERVRKAQEHERSFGRKQDTDILKKRMDSDLFKGGMK